MSEPLIAPALLARLVAEGWRENADPNGYRLLHPVHGRIEWAHPGWRAVRRVASGGGWAETTHHDLVENAVAALAPS